MKQTNLELQQESMVGEQQFTLVLTATCKRKQRTFLIGALKNLIILFFLSI